MGLVHRIVRYGRAVANEFIGLFGREYAFYTIRPRAALLFLTYRCNSRCSTCTFWKRPHKEEKAREIGLEEWKTIIDQIKDAGVKEVEVFGGNVLLRKQLLIGVLRYLKQNGLQVHLPTNQIGLDDEIAEAIISYVDYVYISTDGVGERQDMIRGIRGSAERAESAISRLLRVRDGSGPPPTLVCNTTVSRYNVDVLEGVAAYASEIGFDEIHFEYCGEHTQEHIQDSPIDGLLPTPYFVKQGSESILVDSAGAHRLKGTLPEIRGKYVNAPMEVRTINIDILTQKHLYRGTIPHSKCYMERIEITVDPSGNLIACPFINNYVIGNILTDGFDTVWNNARHRRFREVQNTGKLAVCQHCILGVQRNPGWWTSLKRLYITRISDLRYRLWDRDWVVDSNPQKEESSAEADSRLEPAPLECQSCDVPPNAGSEVSTGVGSR